MLRFLAILTLTAITSLHLGCLTPPGNGPDGNGNTNQNSNSGGGNGNSNSGGGNENSNSGCGNGNSNSGGGTPSPIVPPLESQLAGYWEQTGGDLFTASSGYSLRYLRFDADGGGRMTYHHPTSAALECLDIYFAAPSRLALLLVADNPWFDNDYGMRFLQIERLDPTQLELTDPFGHMAQFSRRPGVPAELVCNPVREIRRIRGLPELGNGQLILAEGHLWYTDDDNRILKLNPADGSIVEAIQRQRADYADIHAYQDGSFWGTSYDLGAGEFQRRTLMNMALDTISSAEMNNGEMYQFSVYSAAFDPASKTLWAFANNRRDNRSYLLQLSTEGEPDKLLQASVFEMNVQAMTWYDGALWLILERSLVRIDVTTRKVTQTYKLPGYDGAWHGATMYPGGAYLLGNEYRTNNATLVEIAME